MKISKELAKGSTGLLVLSVISRGEMYGYQIIKTVEMMSNKVFQMNEGTLYPILHALEKEEFLDSRWVQSEENGRKRKYYKITDKGIHELNSQKQEWEEYSTAVSKVINSNLPSKITG